MIGPAPRTEAFSDTDRLYFLFDFLSHNAWLAWGRARAIAQAHGLHFEPVPVVFGAMLTAHGQRGAGEIAPKSRWMLRDVLRKARQYQVPIAPPYSHPFNPLRALRLACCQLDAATRLHLIDGLWRATWVDGRDVSSLPVLQAVLTELGLDAASLLEEIHTEPVKQRLRANTDTALAAGAFGVPTVRVRGELFWGFDDLDFLEQFLAGRDPLGPEPDFSAWAAVRPSVQRRA